MDSPDGRAPDAAGLLHSQGIRRRVSPGVPHKARGVYHKYIIDILFIPDIIIIDSHLGFSQQPGHLSITVSKTFNGFTYSFRKYTNCSTTRVSPSTARARLRNVTVAPTKGYGLYALVSAPKTCGGVRPSSKLCASGA